MGREIRKVIPNWEHPREECQHSPWAGGCAEAKRSGGKCFQPLYDHGFELAADEWLSFNADWESGADPQRAEEEAELGHRRYSWEYNGDPPDRKYYRPNWTDEQATWFQVYETVSEGTPVTPAFATKEELVDYLVQHGDYWDQYRGQGGWGQANAEGFVGVGFAMSMVVHHTPEGVEIKMPRDGQFEQPST